MVSPSGEEQAEPAEGEHRDREARLAGFAGSFQTSRRTSSSASVESLICGTGPVRSRAEECVEHQDVRGWAARDPHVYNCDVCTVRLIEVHRCIVAFQHRGLG